MVSEKSKANLEKGKGYFAKTTKEAQREIAKKGAEVSNRKQIRTDLWIFGQLPKLFQGIFDIRRLFHAENFCSNSGKKSEFFS